MPVIQRIVEGDTVKCLIDSSNIISSEYNETNRHLKLTFSSGLQYEYIDVLHRDYTRFEISESQGSVFNKTMKNYEYKKLGKINTELIKEEISNIKNATIQTTSKEDTNGGDTEG